MAREEEILELNQCEPDPATVNRAKHLLQEMSRCAHMALHLDRANTNVSQWFFFATMSLGHKVALDELASHYDEHRANINRWIRHYRDHQNGPGSEEWTKRAANTIDAYLDRNGRNQASVVLLVDAFRHFRAKVVNLARSGLATGRDPVLSIGRHILHMTPVAATRPAHVDRRIPERRAADARTWRSAVRGLDAAASAAVQTCMAEMLTARP